VENVAVESDFNTLERGGLRLCLEAGMADIENAVAPHLASIIEQGSVAHLTPEAHHELCLFAALQFVRGTDFRARFAQMVDGVRKKVIVNTGIDPISAEIEKAQEDEEFKATIFATIIGSLGQFASMFAEKQLLLFRRAQDVEFLIGDSPVALNNHRTFGPYGNIGLAVPGIEINLPISADYSLGFWCPSIAAEKAARIEASHKFMQQTAGHAALADRDLAAEVESTRVRTAAALPGEEAFLRGAETGEAIECTSEHVTHFNFVQIRNAERWVMSRDGDFNLARRMIGDDEGYRMGHRVEVT
jgi:hypothetical protein